MDKIFIFRRFHNPLFNFTIIITRLTQKNKYIIEFFTDVWYFRHPNGVCRRVSPKASFFPRVNNVSLYVRATKKRTHKGCVRVVRTKGLEPIRSYPQEPETCASANFAMSAYFPKISPYIGLISVFCNVLSLRSIRQALPPLTTLPATFPSSKTSAALFSIP